MVCLERENMAITQNKQYFGDNQLTCDLVSIECVKSNAKLIVWSGHLAHMECMNYSRGNSRALLVHSSSQRRPSLHVHF